MGYLREFPQGLAISGHVKEDLLLFFFHELLIIRETSLILKDVLFVCFMYIIKIRCL